MPASPALTRRSLEQTRRELACLHPGMEAYGLRSTCHPRAGVDLISPGQGKLLVWCHHCHGEVAVLHVAVAPLQKEA